MRQDILFLLFLFTFSVLLNGQEIPFRLYGKIVWQEDLCKVIHGGKIIEFRQSPDSDETVNFLVRTYAPRGRAVLKLEKKTVFGANKFALSFTPARGREVILSIYGFGEELKSSRELWAAVCIYPETEMSLYWYIFNRTTRKNVQSFIRAPAHKWTVARLRINGPGFFDEADTLKEIGINSRGNGGRSFIIGNFAVWEGYDSVPPSKVRHLTVKPDGDTNIVSWSPATDNLFVTRYRIYRGTVSDFVPNDNTFIMQTETTKLRDKCLMHSNDSYFYKVLAEDVEGNLSYPAGPAKTDRKPE